MDKYFIVITDGIEKMRLYELLSMQDVKNIERKLNANVYGDPKAVGGKAAPIKLVLPTNAHFMDRVKQRSGSHDIDAEELESLLARARLDPNLGLDKIIDKKAKLNEPEGDITIQDPKTKLTIPIAFDPNDHCAVQKFADGIPVCKTPSGTKEPKNIMTAKTIFRKGIKDSLDSSGIDNSRLDELKPSHVKTMRSMEKPEQTPDEFQNFLIKNGYNKLGGGAFASVYSMPGSNAVVKIIKKYGDRCWLDFAEYVKNHPSKFFPKISNIRVYKHTAISNEYGEPNINPVYYCLIEKLVSLDDIPISDTTIDMFCFLHKYYNLSYWGNLADFYMDWLDENNKTVHDMNFDTFVSWRADIYTDGNQFYNVYKNIGQILKSGCKTDMHEGNVMYRPSTNTPVIVDPSYDPATLAVIRGS
jgi:hypothetical protein